MSLLIVLCNDMLTYEVYTIPAGCPLLLPVPPRGAQQCFLKLELLPVRPANSRPLLILDAFRMRCTTG